jgi:hypothetical protein
MKIARHHIIEVARHLEIQIARHNSGRQTSQGGRDHTSRQMYRYADIIHTVELTSYRETDRAAPYRYADNMLLRRHNTGRQTCRYLAA